MQVRTGLDTKGAPWSDRDIDDDRQAEGRGEEHNSPKQIRGEQPFWVVTCGGLLHGRASDRVLAEVRLQKKL